MDSKFLVSVGKAKTTTDNARSSNSICCDHQHNVVVNTTVQIYFSRCQFMKHLKEILQSKMNCET